MKGRVVVLSILQVASLAAYTQQQSPGAPTMTAAPVVFFDIAGPDMDTQRRFYSNVFAWKVDPAGGVKIQLTGSTLSGVLRADPADKVMYIGVKDVTASLAQVVANGGSIQAPRFEVPGVVILGLFRDPAGNLMGLVELGDDGKPKLP
jgi:uncharacterized protein